jgi:hypothetical protein
VSLTTTVIKVKQRWMQPTKPATSTDSCEGSQSWRIGFLLAVVLLVTCVLFLFPPIPQSQAYHDFADKRTPLGIPNCLNVVSNVLFLVVGCTGLSTVWHRPEQVFADSRERWAYTMFFVGLVMTAFGSAYYHLSPRDGSLLWDRIPMALSFSALIAANIGERINVSSGVCLLSPLLIAGAGSVIYWDVTQRSGHGDLRPYVLVQFGSALVLVLLIVLFPPRYTRGADMLMALAIYAAAKTFEATDREIFGWIRVVSGHTLKHIAAAFAAYWILRMIRLRTHVTRATVESVC